MTRRGQKLKLSLLGSGEAFMGIPNNLAPQKDSWHPLIKGFTIANFVSLAERSIKENNNEE